MKIQYLMVPVLSLLQACSHGTDAVAAQDYGRLLIAERYENQAPVNSCSIPIPAPSYSMHTYTLEDHGCKRNSDYFSMSNVASAVEIRFYDQVDCKEVPVKPVFPPFENNWTAHVETIKHPTTTRWVKMTEVRDTPVRGIVVAGVQLLKKEVISTIVPPWEHQLSCVKIRNLP